MDHPKGLVAPSQRDRRQPLERIRSPSNCGARVSIERLSGPGAGWIQPQPAGVRLGIASVRRFRLQTGIHTSQKFCVTFLAAGASRSKRRFSQRVAAVPEGDYCTPTVAPGDFSVTTPCSALPPEVQFPVAMGSARTFPSLPASLSAPNKQHDSDCHREPSEDWPNSTGHGLRFSSAPGDVQFARKMVLLVPSFWALRCDDCTTCFTTSILIPGDSQ